MLSLKTLNLIVVPGLDLANSLKRSGYEESSLLIDYIRNTSKPGFIEANTYRWLGHVDWREDLDVGVTRSREELLSWKLKDPIKHFLDMIGQMVLVHHIKQMMVANPTQHQSL